MRILARSRSRQALALLLLLMFAVALVTFYADIRRKVIEDFNIQQLLLVKQAAKGIRHQFEQFYGEMSTLVLSPDIVEMNASGEQLLQQYVRQHGETISAITRVSATGKILYTVPFIADRIGVDISGQEHVKEILSTHKPVISDVFTAVQGYQAVACHIPVWREGAFDGTIGILTPFSAIAKDHIESIKPAPGCHTWALSRGAVELYCPLENHIGKPASEGCGRQPAVQELIETIIEQNEGTAAYKYTSGEQRRNQMMQAAFTEVKLNGTSWYVVSSAPEQEILSTITGFRNRLLFFGVILTLAGMLYAVSLFSERLRARENILRRETEAEKQRLAEQYQRAQKMESIGRLAAGLAHDLNNMLTPILGYAEMLEDDAGPGSDQLFAAQQITQAAMRARGLTRQLLAFGRKQPLSVKSLDINDLVKGLRGLIRRTLRENIELRVNLDNLPCTVIADQGQIEQVLMNLVVNAQDAIAEQGVLCITTAHREVAGEVAEKHGGPAEGLYVTLSVEDSGRGIDAATLTNIFEPFYSTKGEHGTGLGLATAHGIVTQHGGGIWVESEPGRGALFTVLLPAANGCQEHSETVPEKRHSVQGGTVLLVEDDPDVRKLTQYMLKHMGYDVLTAAGGLQALEILRGGKVDVDLLLTDVIMPQLNGRQLYEQACTGHPQLKVLYMSGYTDEVLTQSGFLPEDVRLINKPFSAPELAAKISEALQG